MDKVEKNFIHFSLQKYLNIVYYKIIEKGCESLKDAFIGYVEKYDLNLPEYSIKYHHSLRVMNLAKKYSKLLGFTDEDIEIASIIGLLHDIGRFEQFRIYHSFSDSKTFDHANYGAKMLFKNNLIEKFYHNSQHYKIIEYAIKNHNKLAINTKYKSKKMIKHAKLLRDIDKIDIIFLNSNIKEIRHEATSQSISNRVINSIKKHESVNKKHIKNINDKIAFRFSFAFDINYDICLRELKENLICYYYSINDQEKKLKNIFEEVMNYIDNRLNNK